MFDEPPLGPQAANETAAFSSGLADAAISVPPPPIDQPETPRWSGLTLPISGLPARVFSPTQVSSALISLVARTLG
ncbi:hypothetical protein D3C83_145800 [compost metagenome]